jgi:hypothetical protein
MSNNDLLEKVIRTTEVGSGGGGLLNAEQSNRFIDYMWDSTVLAKEGRVVRMKSDTVDIDKVNVGQRIARLATEAVDDGVNAPATFSKVSLTTQKIRLDWELTSESIEDNIEGAGLEDHIARMMATALGNDLEDLAINGDTASSDPLLKSYDGFKKLVNASGVVVDAQGATLSGTNAGEGKAVFNRAIKNMPRKYLQRRNQLRFYSGSNLTQDYLFGLTNISATPEDIAAGIIQGNPAARDGSAGTVTPFAFGIPVKEVPLFDETSNGTYSGATGQHGYVELTFPQNRIWGVKREVTVHREFVAKKDAIEYTVFVRSGVQVENQEAYVHVKNIKVAS